MNRLGPRVFIVHVTTWWLVWITWPGQWRGRSDQHLAAEQAPLTAFPEVGWSCAEGSLAAAPGSALLSWPLSGMVGLDGGE